MAKQGGNRQAGWRRVLQEMIGRVSPPPKAAVWQGGRARVSVDRTQTDYAFWAKLRRGQQKGYELGGLFAQPMAEIVTGWLLGEGAGVEMSSLPPHASAVEAVNQFLAQNRQIVWEWVYDSLTLGDAYLVVNPDGSLTPIPPDQVEVVTDAADWRRVLAYRVTTRLESATVVDDYRLDGRTLSIHHAPPTNGPQRDVREYENLIGRLPVIHLANDREANEIYGHPLYEGLLRLFAEYDEVLRKSLDGVKIMGHPIPVIEGMDDPAETLAMNANDTDRWLDGSGNWQERPVVDFGRLSMMILGKGGQFKFASPGQLSGDAGRLLEYLFLLMLQHAKIPEWVWGGAIASSKASVDAQRPAFTRMIQARRSRLEAALVELVRVWSATMALQSPTLTSALRIGEANVEGGWRMVWPALVAEEQSMTLRKVELAYSHEIISRDEARVLLGL